jgi:superfamily II DNA or RNA helicase
MEIRFDRGTLVLLDGPDGLDLEGLRGVRWDPRVGVHRAPANRHAEIRAALEGRGVRFLDRVPATLPVPGTFREFDLRPYQEEAYACWAARGRRGVVVLPTGSGKTRLAAAAIAREQAPAICLVPTRVLVEQWRKVLGEFYEGEVGCFGDGERVLAPVTVSTYESAWRNMERLGNRFSLLVVDEVHHFGGGGREEALEMCCAAARLGLTATPPEAPAAVDRLTNLMGPVVFQLSIDDLAGEYLAGYQIVTQEVDLDLDERVSYEEWMELFRAVHGRFTKLHPHASWEDFVRESGGTDAGRRALAAWRSARRLLAFCRSKRTRLAELLRRHAGARILVFTGDNEAAYAVAREHLIMPLTCDIGRAERDAVLSAFRAGKLRALVSSQVLNEGFDVPDAEVAIIVAGRLGKREHVQRIGRLLRPALDKRALVYELVVGGTVEVRQTARKRQGLAARSPASH